MKIVIFFLSLICSLEINLFQKYDDNVSIILFYQRFQRFLFDVNIENICWQEPTWHRYVKIYLMAGEKVGWESLFGNFLQNPQTKIIHWASLCEIEGSSQFGHCKHFRSALVKARLETQIWDLLLVIKCIVKISVENEPRSFRCPHIFNISSDSHFAIPEGDHLPPSINNMQCRQVEWFSAKTLQPRPPLFLSGSQSETDLKEAISCVGPGQPDARLKTSVLLSISSAADKFTGEQGPPVLG